MCAGEQFANGGEQPGVSGRVGARCAADRRLVDIDNLVEQFQTLYGAVGSRLRAAVIELTCCNPVQGVIDQGRLA